MTQKLDIKKVDGIQLIDENSAAIAAIDEVIAYGKEALQTVSGMKKAVMAANFVCQMKAALTPEAMGPIMSLQGTGLGFRTDKESSGGYPVETVKNCMIEAAAMGLGAVGNQFNIISSRMYVTKEGAGQLLKNIGIRHSETPMAPEITNGQAKSKVIVEWKDADGDHRETLEFLVRVNSGMGADAVNGKAVRKARMWLYGRITGMELADGDIDEAREPVDITPKKSAFSRNTAPASQEAPPAPEIIQEQEPEPAPSLPDMTQVQEALDHFKIMDISTADIIAYHQAGNWDMNIPYICQKIIAVTEAVRKWKTQEASHA